MKRWMVPFFVSRSWAGSEMSVSKFVRLYPPMRLRGRTLGVIEYNLLHLALDTISWVKVTDIVRQTHIVVRDHRRCPRYHNSRCWSSPLSEKFWRNYNWAWLKLHISCLIISFRLVAEPQRSFIIGWEIFITSRELFSTPEDSNLIRNRLISSGLGLTRSSPVWHPMSSAPTAGSPSNR